ncbi:unnamed protein product [Paramecium sonneborni]|uniref:Uncharacterized protein n=1 Tax=Paramecium sonneborni TaxID=65129 RepID=A0A8S1QYQ7_9CILI|nr:unnamed protein product [Paramecium sonneborni]
MFKNKTGQSGIKLIFGTNIIQSSWWIIQAIQMHKPINYLLCFLQIGSLLLKIIQTILILQNKEQKLIVHVITLLYSIIQIESYQILAPTHQLDNFIISLLLFITYTEYLKLAVQKFSYICKFGIPCYLMCKIIWELIESFSYFSIECLVIIIIVSIHILIKKDIELTKLDQNFENKLIDCQQNKNNQKESPFVQLNKTIQAEIKSQSQNSNVQSAKNSFSLLKELPSDQKLSQYSNLTSLSKSKQFNKTLLYQENSLLQFYQNLINLYPYGILMLNQQQQITYINNKCEKILECQGAEMVLEKIRSCVNDAKMEENIQDSSSSNSHIDKKKKPLFNQDVLKQIVRNLQSKNLYIDVFDIILQPFKYYKNLDLNDESSNNKEINQKSFNQQLFIYEWLFKSNIIQEKQTKKIKLIIIPTTMINIQQEYFPSPSQVKFSTKNCLQGNEQEPNVLLIIIKNISNKHHYQNLKDQQIIHHSLIKSFSHELRTPLNSCQQMLTLMRNGNKTKNFLEQLDLAQCSISLLTNQINDILDYAAIQTNQFSYHYTTFQLQSIIADIESLYKQQMSHKNIKFKIKATQILTNIMIYNDKQRIFQILINLLNNAIKFTQEGGFVKINFTEVENCFINIKVKDNGIGIKKNRLLEIQNRLRDIQDFGAILKQNTEYNRPGLGLTIASKLVKGLINSNDNQLRIFSKENKGTVIQFQIQNKQQNIYASSHPNSQQTGRFNQIGNQYTFSERKSDDQIIFKSSLSNQKIQNVESFEQQSSSYNNTSRLNDKDEQSVIFLPNSPNYFSHQIVHQNIIKQSNICLNCTHVLIVDDIPFNQIALKMILNHHNIIADQAFDGFQAIEKVKTKLQQHCQIYKLIFMDIEMPGLDGFQASKQILELTQQQSMIVICSAYDTKENFEKGQKMGIYSFLPKPIKKDELEVLLNAIFNLKSQ